MIAFRRFLSLVGLGGLQRNQGLQFTQPGSRPIDSPEPVTFDTAMQLSAVWACTRLLSETIASLPLSFTRDDVQVTGNPVADVFAGKVNRYQTRMEFMETMALNLVMTGNAYALKQFSGARLVGLLPLMSGQVETGLLEDGSVVHHYYHDKGVDILSSDSVWHVKLFGNGVIGMSPISYAHTTIGVALGGEKRVAQIFKNGGKPSGVLTIDKVLNDAQRKQIKAQFNELREGNNDPLMVLEANMQYQQVSMTPQDIELLSSRRFQIEDIARFFGVPSVLINDTSGTTAWGSGIFQIVQGFHKLNLRPYLVRFESSIRNNLLAPEDRRRITVKFDLDDLLRADMQTRYEAWQKALNSGQITPNEARENEGRAPIEGGDELYVNSTMVPLRQAGRQIQQPTGTD